jgi:CRP-like cAMP-binding protein
MHNLGEKERAALLDRFGRTYRAGEVVFADGDPADACFLINEGKTRLFKRVRRQERSLAVLRAGDVFGEDALLEGMTRVAHAVAITDTKLMAFDRKTFKALIAGNPEVALRLVEQLVRRLRESEEQLENTMLRDHPSRIVNSLLRLSASAEAGEGGHTLHISPLELSGRVGLDVDAVKRAIQQLRDGGYVRIAEEQIILPELDALRRLFQLLGDKEEVRGA